MRGLVKENNPLAINGWSMLIGGTVALSHSYMTESWSPLPVSEWTPFLEGAITLLIISNFLAYNLYGYLLKKFTATFISFAGFTTPLFTAFFGYLLLGEKVTWPFAFSYLVVYLGLRLFYREEIKAPVKVG
jgi:drug/metabolite transporter (DMT)-like permease